MIGIIGLVKFCGTHKFLVLICFIDVCFLAYELGSRNQEMSKVTRDLFHQTRLVQKETEDLVQENLNFFRKYILDKQKERSKIKQLTEQLESIEAMLEDMKESHKLKSIEFEYT